MRAICYDSFGAASDVLSVQEFEDQPPGPGEVQVRLRFSGVNPSDAKARAGLRPGVTEPPFPQVVPHSDGSGVIEAVGDGVPEARVGERVWVYNGGWQRAFGTAAETITLPTDQAVALPDAVSDEIGATLGIPGLTAAQTVFGGGDVSGKTLLISGGAGAVGHNAVQLAAWGGAQVIATCSASAFDDVQAAGAAHVFDYKDPDLAAQILEATNGQGVDRAVEVEFGQNANLLTEVMRPLGTIATYGSGKSMTPEMPFGPMMFKALKIDITLIYILPAPARAAAIARLHDALTSRGLTPRIDQVFDFENCAEAQDAVMTPGRKGAVLLRTY